MDETSGISLPGLTDQHLMSHVQTNNNTEYTRCNDQIFVSCDVKYILENGDLNGMKPFLKLFSIWM